MPKETVGKIFVNEFVLGFGFLSGLWVYAGIDPEDAIINAFAQLAPNMGFFFWLVPIVGLLVSVLVTYSMGGKIGLISVGLAFIGGIFIGSFGLWLVLFACFLGLIAPNMKDSF